LGCIQLYERVLNTTHTLILILVSHIKLPPERSNLSHCTVGTERLDPFRVELTAGNCASYHVIVSEFGSEGFLGLFELNCHVFSVNVNQHEYYYSFTTISIATSNAPLCKLCETNYSLLLGLCSAINPFLTILPFGQDFDLSFDLSFDLNFDLNFYLI